MAEKMHLEESTRNRKFVKFDREAEEKWTGPFVFIQAADTQFGMIHTYILKKSDFVWEQEIILTTKAIEAANRMIPTPRFFIVCGDLVDAMPGVEAKTAQETDFMKTFSQLKPDIPLVCVCGNHDIGNTPTHESVENYRQTFGDDYFSFFCGGVKFIVLNSQYYEDPSLVLDLAEKQEIWLEQELEEVKRGVQKHTIIFQHIPWFITTSDEEKEYFNIVPELRLKMLKKFEEAGVRTIFCGHCHRNAGGFYKDMELVITSAIGAQLGDDGSGMRVVRVLENGIKHQYYTLDNVPSKIDLL